MKHYFKDSTTWNYLSYDTTTEPRGVPKLPVSIQKAWAEESGNYESLYDQPDNQRFAAAGDDRLYLEPATGKRRKGKAKSNGGPVNVGNLLSYFDKFIHYFFTLGGRL